MASALERVRANTFEVRDATAPPPVGVGYFVKVGMRGERFWCKVDSMSGDGTLDATVDNELLRSPAWPRGHKLILQREHVLESASVAEMLSFQRLAAATGSMREGALLWRDMRAMQGVCARPEPARPVVPE